MDRPFSHLVTTQAVLAQLRTSIQLPPASEWPAGFDLAGIRVVACRSKEEAFLRARELREDGCNVQLMN